MSATEETPGWHLGAGALEHDHMISTPCIACSDPLRPFGSRLTYLYAECTTCRTLQLVPMPNAAALEAAYADHYTEVPQSPEFGDPDRWAAAGAPYRQDLLRTVIERRVQGPIVDVGAGWGHLCSLLQAHGFECSGVEPSTVMAAYCHRQGLPVIQGGLEMIEASKGPAGALLLCAVFEHLTEHEAWLTRARAVLRDDGYLITLQPTASCYRLLAQLVRFRNRRRELPEFHGTFAPPWHTALFSIKGMYLLAARSGFQIVEVRPASQGKAGGWFGTAQRLLGAVNQIGARIVGPQWPLVTSHIFVLRKV